MGFVSYISYLDARRPLVFLCGPAIGNDKKADRRCIFRRHIHAKWKRTDDADNKKYIYAFPIIIEELIDSKKCKENYPDIKVNILEEIVANISYKTYIFLDTMSTSYELGQFTNFAYNMDSASILVDNQYKQRINNSIGEYIEMSFAKKLIEYPASYNNKGHIFFPLKRNKHPIPKELIEVLNKDNPVSSSQDFLKPITFSYDEKRLGEFGCIIYQRIKNTLVFSFNIKNLFYFISAVYRHIMERHSNINIFKMPKSINDESFLSFVETIKKELLTSFVMRTSNDLCQSYLLSPDFDLKIKVGDINSNELIYHILYMSFSLFNHKGKFDYVVPQMKNGPEGMCFSNNEADIVCITNSHIDKLLFKYHLSNIKSGTQKRTIRVRNKMRSMVCYSNDYQGRQLKYLHSEIYKSLLAILPSSNCSFAYKKGLNTLKCLECHKGNIYFAKFDIHHFFESITLSRVRNKIVGFIQAQYKKRFNKMKSFLKDSNNISNNISKLIRPLFVDYRLPIGFINSPKISDFYLFDLDEEMNIVPDIIYTRYADDILISSNSLDSLDKAKEMLVSLLNKESLKINELKTRKGTLKNSGDSFKFLGVNIVLRDDRKFELTISKKYIVETSKMICSFFEKLANDKSFYYLDIIQGRIKYIRSVSRKSFNNLNKMVEIKTNGKANLADVLNLRKSLLKLDLALFKS